MGQVQYAFLELGKFRGQHPETNNERWAALFTSAPALAPEDVANEPLSDAQREALELARFETFTAQEREAVARSEEEVDQVRRTILAHQSRAEAAEQKAEAAEQKAEAAEQKAEAAEQKASAEAKARAEAEQKAAAAEARMRELEALLASRRQGG